MPKRCRSVIDRRSDVSDVSFSGLFLLPPTSPLVPSQSLGTLWLYSNVNLYIATAASGRNQTVYTMTPNPHAKPRKTNPQDLSPSDNMAARISVSSYRSSHIPVPRLSRTSPSRALSWRTRCSDLLIDSAAVGRPPGTS